MLHAPSSSVPPLVLTAADFERLQRLIIGTDSPEAELLDAELERAQVVPPQEVAGDVVTMNSDVVYEDVSSRQQRQVRVVYPEDVDIDRHWVSVLAPLGSALIGMRVGQQIEWRMPRGVRRLRILGVPYQPEASGHYGP